MGFSTGATVPTAIAKVVSLGGFGHYVAYPDHPGLTPRRPISPGESRT